MPMKNVKRGIEVACPAIDAQPVSARNVAEAIMTSDTRRKEIAIEFKLGTSRCGSAEFAKAPA